MSHESFVGPQFSTGTPVTLSTLHREQKTPYLGRAFGQDVEPAGRYVVVGDPSEHTEQAGYEHRVEEVHNPLVVPFGGGYEEDSNWKRVLSRQYSAKGRSLSAALKRNGHDAIITYDEYGPSETVLLK